MKYGAGRKDVIGKVPPLAAGDRQKHHPKQSRQGARSIRSLVVDDDSTILKCVTFMLSLLGFEKVDTAQREIEAMSKLAAGRPYDLIGYRSGNARHEWVRSVPNDQNGDARHQGDHHDGAPSGRLS